MEAAGGGAGGITRPKILNAFDLINQCGGAFAVCVCMCLYVSVCVCMCLYVTVCDSMRHGRVVRSQYSSAARPTIATTGFALDKLFAPQVDIKADGMGNLIKKMSSQAMIAGAGGGGGGGAAPEVAEAKLTEEDYR